jgi:hypothetical protein
MLCEPQQVKHPGLVEDDSANDLIERFLAKERLSSRQSFRAKKLVTSEDTFKHCAWF